MALRTSSIGPARPPDTAADLELAGSAASGDRAARHRLVARLIDPLRRTLSYLAASEADAEDLTQSALIRALESAGTYRGDCPLEGWARRIAIRVATRRQHKSRRRRELREASWSPPREAIAQDEAADRNAIRRRVRDHLQTLPHKQRTALVLHLVEGYTAAEVAAISEVPLGTARDRLLRGRAGLKKKIVSDPELRSRIEARTR
jgi:RNA polymerase sigma-70 factor, ECF subfamily